MLGGAASLPSLKSKIVSGGIVLLLVEPSVVIFNVIKQFSLLGFVFFVVFISRLDAQEKLKFGWLEKVAVYPGNILIHAKLDTGADYSSLNASNLVEFEKGDQKWVRFDLEDRFGKKSTIEKPVVRIAWVKRQSGKHSKRNVIRLGICLGKTFMEADVNLVDRTNYTQQMLVGRNFLAGNAVIDPAVSYTQKPDCKGVPAS